MTRTGLLARTFLARFFESDLLPPGLPQAQLVIWSMALLATPGLFLSVRMANGYSRLGDDPVAMAQSLLFGRLVFITLSMTAMGLVALVLWENVFPDRRDARQLGVLPLPGRVLVAARLLALTGLAGIFLVGVNALPTLTYAPLIGYYGGAASVAHGVTSHLVATACAGTFVFFALIAVQGTLLNIGGRRFADRFALVFQLLFVVAILQQLLLLPRLGSFLQADLRSIVADPTLRAIPSFWFLGLYDVLGGRSAAGSEELARIGIAATVAVVAIAAGMLVATHHRLMRMAIEGREPARKGARTLQALLRPVLALGCRGPIERAVFGFTARTLVRSRSHRLLLAMYLGVGLAVLVVVISPLVVRRGLAGFATPSVAVLAVPFVLQFFTLTAVRLLVSIPVEPKANWIVRLLEPADRRAAIAGTRAVLLVGGVLPGVLVGALSAGLLWGAWPGLAHAAVCLAAGWVLAELLLTGLRKIPFTCTYSPGRSRIQLWPFYLLAFSNYCFTTAAIDLALLERPRGLALCLATLAALVLVLQHAHGRALSAPPGLRFEEEDPEALFEGFRLSEALAARAGGTRTVVAAPGPPQ